MKKILRNIWQREEGAETAEWLVIVASLVVIATGVYGGVLDTELTDLVGFIGDQFPGAGP
jgi:Flp pilus assembly pilin Flp